MTATADHDDVKGKSHRTRLQEGSPPTGRRVWRNRPPPGSQYDRHVQGRANRTLSTASRFRRAQFGLVGRFTLLLIVTALLVTSVITTAKGEWRPAFPERRRTFAPAVRNSVERDLREQGVRISPAIHAMLGPLLTAWEDRPELRKLFSDASGRPDIPRLLDWAEPLPDSFSSAIVAHLGAIIELRSRLGLLRRDQQILPVLYWTLDNRERKFSGLGPVIARLADVWRARPELREQFTTDNRVDVRGLLQWVNTLPPSDPQFVQFYGQYLEIRQAILELDRMQHVNARG